MRRLSVRRGVFAASMVLLSSTAFMPSVRAADAQLPNLQTRTPKTLFLGYADEGDFTNPYEALRFDMATRNVGQYALDVLGLPPEGTESTAANQCVAWDPTLPHVCAQREEVGTFEFHAAHRHWHFNDFALYELRKLTKKGAVDMTATGLVATAGKVSFCLEDYEPNTPDPSTTQVGFYVSCSGVYQGISSGWSDVYTSDLAGQQILVGNVPDGTYALVLTTNPLHILRETNYTDNTVVQKLRLTTTATGACTTTRTVDPVT